MFQFLWVGNMRTRKIHLSSWESISLPKNMGSLGLKHLDFLNSTLSMKSLCHGIIGNGLWSSVLKEKYIKIWTISQWFQNPCKNATNDLIIWRKFLKVYPMLGEILSWKIGHGT